MQQNIKTLPTPTPEELANHERIEKERRKIMVEACREEAKRIIGVIDIELNVNGPVSLVRVFKDALIRAENFAKVIRPPQTLP